MNFKRNKNHLGTTWAFNAFVEHHTEINNMYWAFVPAWSYTHYLARKNNTSTPEALFYASGPNIHRLDSSIPQFLQNSELLANWIRLSALLSALSYFEIYLKKVITLSLMSDPAVRLGKPMAIEGVSWLKMGIKDEVEPLIISCIKGDWCSRKKGFKRLFLSIPPLMEAKTSELDEIRIIRNKIGHSYGRNLNIDILETKIPSMEKLSEENLKKSLELIFDVAKDTDSHLLNNHIGSFEELLFFHEWRQTLKGTQRLDEKKHLKKALNKLQLGQNLSTPYCDNLVDFYHSC